MRKRRVILFDDNPHVLDALTLLFEGEGYDVIARREPTPCPVIEDSSRCDGKQPCADIVTTDLDMPGMNGIELLATQARRGCPIPSMNKAVLSGNLDAAAMQAIRLLGCAWFRKPTRLAPIMEWIRECEFRMDLSQPLQQPRKERRAACFPASVVAIGPRGDVAAIVNTSSSGMCLRIGWQPTVAQVLDVRTQGATPPEPFAVRWTKPEISGAFLAGLSRV